MTWPRSNPVATEPKGTSGLDLGGVGGTVVVTGGAGAASTGSGGFGCITTSLVLEPCTAESYGSGDRMDAKAGKSSRGWASLGGLIMTWFQKIKLKGAFEDITSYVSTPRYLVQMWII